MVIIWTARSLIILVSHVSSKSIIYLPEKSVKCEDRDRFCSFLLNSINHGMIQVMSSETKTQKSDLIFCHSALRRYPEPCLLELTPTSA